MEAVLEVGVLRKAVHTADLLRDGHNHLVKQESVALAVCKREVQHVPDALDPHSKSLALLQFAGCPQILANWFRQMPDVVGVLQRAKSSCHLNLAELLHQRLQLGAAVRGEDANVHSLIVQAPQEQFRRKWLHFPRVLNLKKIINSVMKTITYPHFFGLPRSGSTSQMYWSGSCFGFGPFYSKYSKKNLNFYCFETSFWLFIFENNLNVTSKSNKQ